MPTQFLTVAEELLDVAERLVEHFQGDGYSVTVEDVSRPDYPYMPTLRCRRGTTTLLLEVVDALPSKEHVREWCAFCSSQSSDTRYALGLRLGINVPVDELAVLRDKRVGVYAVDDTYSVSELLNPHDLALNLNPPTLTSYPNKVRAVLGQAWEELRRGNWREGFDSACIALEVEVRRYLKRHTNAGRLVFQTVGGAPRVYTNKTIDRMTLGQLKDALAMVREPNHADSILREVLKKLNPDRIRIAHRRGEPSAEATLRRRVPAHLWSIVRGVEQAIK